MIIRPLLTVCGLLLMLGLFFVVERLSVERRLRFLKLRVAVTGTRGKSSVTRLVAAALRQSGLNVLAKTTGSAAMVLWPDGTERELQRSGPPTILEHKSILRLARRLEAEALVSEMMSIRPECLRVEAQKLLKPQVLLITNVRLDHREELGLTREAVARSLAAGIPPGGAVLVSDDDFFPVFAERAAEVGAKVVRVPAGAIEPPLGGAAFSPTEFEENIRLALAAADFLGVPRAAALRGMANRQPDPGGLRIYRAKIGSPPAPWILASAFAANEPQSSRMALERIRNVVPFPRGALAAVLNLRDDRGDRTLQWLTAIQDDFFREFEAVALVGSRAVSALRRKTRRLENGRRSRGTRFSVLTENSPEAVTAALASAPGFERGGVLVGLGNMGGLGRRLVDYWERIGERLEQSRA